MEVTPYGSLPLKLKYLVRACQFLGIWCFKISPSPASPNRVVANVPLLLWVIFMKTFQVNVILYSSLTMIKFCSEIDVGIMIGWSLFIVSSILLVVGQISFVTHCPTLCHILSECEADAWPKVKEFSVEKIMNLAFYCSYVFIIILTWIYKQDSDASQILDTFFFSLNMISIMVITLIFREMLNLAASNVSINNLHLNEQPFHLHTGAAECGPLLHLLERKILKMEHLRGKTVDCFLTSISLSICNSLFMITANMYYIIYYLKWKAYTPFPPCFFYLMAGFATLIHTCYSAHNFSQHVRRVCDELRKMRTKVRGLEDRTQLDYLISTLDRMETFNMGSWFCLSPNTLVSVSAALLGFPGTEFYIRSGRVGASHS
ncbi:uncharacterized protein LOC135103342 [Scylla paramamosain]|uniref:uncharacterized protein LOC135103342 n=1 Tax=Scylla paramamosain TaxID=85552 RepID=UPI003083CCEA